VNNAILRQELSEKEAVLYSELAAIRADHLALRDWANYQQKMNLYFFYGYAFILVAGVAWLSILYRRKLSWR